MSRLVWALILLLVFACFPAFCWAFVYHPIWAVGPLAIAAGFLFIGARLDR